MNLRDITVALQEDGFAIVDPENIVSAGIPLRVRYELASGWVTKDIEFEVTDHPTLFHPFRKRSMFIYTGEEPVRVIVQEMPDLAGGHWGTKMARSDFDRQSFYPSRNFRTYPEYDQPIWQCDDYLPTSLGVAFEDTTVDPQFMASGSTPIQLEAEEIPAADAVSGDQPDAADADFELSSDQGGGEPNAY